jgi:hypothetical protein
MLQHRRLALFRNWDTLARQAAHRCRWWLVSPKILSILVAPSCLLKLCPYGDREKRTH